MTRHRTIILIVGCLIAFGVAPSGAASANSLLSGYGGPGQGNQAILGSALLHRPGGGSGSSGGSGESGSLASSSAGPASSEATAPSDTASSKSSAAGHGKSPSQSSGARHSSTHRSTARSASSPTVAELYAAAERDRPAPSTPALGLSGAELLLIVLVLGMLALIAVLSRRLARVSGAASSRGADGG